METKTKKEKVFSVVLLLFGQIQVVVLFVTLMQIGYYRCINHSMC